MAAGHSKRTTAASKVYKRCQHCGQDDQPHRKRGDSESLRGRCDECLSSYMRQWRTTINWQRRKLYDTWRGAVRRCTDHEHKSYPKYGGAGITVAKRWLGPKGFETFMQDMGPPPTERHQLDRIRPTRGYSPSNCRWATLEEQNRNRRDVVLITAPDPRGATPDALPWLTLTMAEWSRLTGISRDTISSRKKRGWPDAQCVSPTQPEGCPF